MQPLTVLWFELLCVCAACLSPQQQCSRHPHVILDLEGLPIIREQQHTAIHCAVKADALAGL